MAFFVTKILLLLIVIILLAIAYILIKQYFKKGKDDTQVNITDRNGNITQINVNGKKVKIESDED